MKDEHADRFFDARKMRGKYPSIMFCRTVDPAGPCRRSHKALPALYPERYVTLQSHSGMRNMSFWDSVAEKLCGACDVNTIWV